jgi:hypothetical protein
MTKRRSIKGEGTAAAAAAALREPRRIVTRSVAAILNGDHIKANNERHLEANGGLSQSNGHDNYHHQQQKSPSANMGGSLPKPTRPLSTEEEAAANVVPQDVPSILELKKSLPAHCFKPTVAKSMYFVLKVTIYNHRNFYEKSLCVICNVGCVFWAQKIPHIYDVFFVFLKDFVIITVLYLIQIALETHSPTPLLK